jgi:hypothetical protein
MSRYSRSSSTDDGTTIKCGCYLVILLVNILVGGWSVNYLLMTFADKSIPFFWATVIGAFVGEISIPVAVVVAILRAFGIL